MTSMPLSFDVTRVDYLAHVACSKCDALLSIHEPDPEMPERLLGTCDQCKSWYLLDALKGEMVVIHCESLFGGA